MTEAELREIEKRVEALRLKSIWEGGSRGDLRLVSRDAIDFLHNARQDVPAMLVHIRMLEDLLWRATTDSEAYELGRQQERVRIMADVQGLVDWWMETSTAERLKVGPVRALGELLDRLRREGAPNPLLPPDVLRAENEALRAKLEAVEWCRDVGRKGFKPGCPQCRGARHRGGHRFDCSLAAILHGKGGQQP